MNKLKIFLISAIALSSSSLLAVEGNEEKSIDQMLSSLKLEKMQAESMVARMERSGRMDSNEALRAKREIASVYDGDVEQIKNRAIERISSRNSVATK